MNRACTELVVTAAPGGTGRDGATLTAFGAELLERYRRVLRYAESMEGDDLVALAPRLRPDVDPAASPQDEVKAYDQLCLSYRAIDDFRAKLLGFLPLATGAGIWTLFDKVQKAQPDKFFPAAVGVFGVIITMGLFFYEIYGVKKCAALIAAGKRIEGLLHVYNGQFINRPQNVARVINEPLAAGVVYPTVLAAWLFFALYPAWREAKPWWWLIPIIVFVTGLVGTLIYDYILRKEYGSATGNSAEIRLEIVKGA
jgi:hypothetical protein